MPTQLIPALVSHPTWPDASAVLDLSIGQAFFIQSPRGTRVMQYDGALYCIFYYSYTSFDVRVAKSTDNGLTWAILDEANSPLLVNGGSNSNSSCVIQGTKFRFVFNHVVNVAGTRTYTVKIYTFDCATELWDASVISGPTDSIAAATPPWLMDAVLRGTDEIVVLHRLDLSAVGSAISIYNTTSATWTTSSLPVFTGAGSFFAQDGECLLWDGKYVHIFASPRADAGGGVTRIHITLDPSNTLGTEVDIYDSFDPGWIDPGTYVGGSYVTSRMGYFSKAFPILYAGKIWLFQDGNFDQVGSANTNKQIVAWVADYNEMGNRRSLHGYRNRSPILARSLCLWRQSYAAVSG